MRNYKWALGKLEAKFIFLSRAVWNSWQRIEVSSGGEVFNGNALLRVTSKRSWSLNWGPAFWKGVLAAREVGVLWCRLAFPWRLGLYMYPLTFIHLFTHSFIDSFLHWLEPASSRREAPCRGRVYSGGCNRHGFCPGVDWFERTSQYWRDHATTTTVFLQRFKVRSADFLRETNQYNPPSWMVAFPCEDGGGDYTAQKEWVRC